MLIAQIESEFLSIALFARAASKGTQNASTRMGRHRPNRLTSLVRRDMLRTSGVSGQWYRLQRGES